MTYGTEAWRKPTTPDGHKEIFSEHGRVLPVGRNMVTYESYWLTISRAEGGYYFLHVKHGAGEETYRLEGCIDYMMVDTMSAMGSDSRYALMFTLYSTAREAASAAKKKAQQSYALAFVEGRLKKRRKNNRIWVEMLPQIEQAAS